MSVLEVCVCAVVCVLAVLCSGMFLIFFACLIGFIVVLLTAVVPQEGV